MIEAALGLAPRVRKPLGRRLRPVERARILRRAADMIRERNPELARLETLDTGKPIQETLVADWPSGADALEYFAGLAPTVTGETIPLGRDFVYTIREALGVCVGIGAWNYPSQIACWKSAPALGFGQCDGVQAVRSHAFGRPETGRDLYRSGSACGVVQRRAGPRRGRGRSGQRSAGGQGFADRIGADRAKGLCSGGGRHAACDDGAGRQIAPDRL